MISLLTSALIILLIAYILLLAADEDDLKALETEEQVETVNIVTSYTGRIQRGGKVC